MGLVLCYKNQALKKEKGKTTDCVDFAFENGGALTFLCSYSFTFTGRSFGRQLREIKKYLLYLRKETKWATSEDAGSWRRD
jgi:hypothetical protein